MKKIIFLLLAFVIIGVSSAQAQSYTGSYTGTMDEIRMNDKEYSSQSNQVFTLAETTLSGAVSKIGSMPGVITITQQITVDGTGNVTATDSECGTLKVLKLIPIPLTLTSLTGKVMDDGSLEFTLECTGTYLGKDYKAHIHFSGTK